MRGSLRHWRKQAVHVIKADANRSADTNLLRVWFPKIPHIDLYFKDESAHKTGSLKHRMARRLFMYAIIDGHIKEGLPVIEASSGNTAVSEAYFAQILGLDFIAVLSKKTSPYKIHRIEQLGGTCHLLEPNEDDRKIALKIALETNGHFMNQFRYAEKVMLLADDSIADAINRQLSMERYPIPIWYVCGAGTGGTADCISANISYNNLESKLCVVDPEYSCYYDAYMKGDTDITIKKNSLIEGIGRKQVEQSFNPHIIDRMIKVPDAASVAAIQWLKNLTGMWGGGSTGTNLYACLQLINEINKQDQKGSIVTLMCDRGMVYQETYYNPQWLEAHHLNIKPYLQQIQHFYDTTEWLEISEFK